ncbi:AMP-binding protein [Baekduia soli]|uniref:AMP-binding protein n=1 Tax=Baekduia soli TaxID=496014 RepID=A0A5B8U7G6_9ACTN|nr:AMP-binding protein [Baekduia soli]QEC48768.1 AMP-binding protein [Baekduia soli]
MRIWAEATTVGDLVDRAATETTGDAVVFPGRRASYPELARRTDDCARSLLALGVGPGDKVALFLPDGLDVVVALVATTKLGAVPVPVNGRFKARELQHVVAHSDARILLTATATTDEGTDHAGIVAEVFPAGPGQDDGERATDAAPHLRRIVDLTGARPGFLSRAAFEAAAQRVGVGELRTLQNRVRLRDIALLMYTSGTTSRPKGCLITHEAIVRHGAAVCRRHFLLTERDRLWDPLPLFHCGGIVLMIGTFAARAAFVHTGAHFDADTALRQLEEERCTVAYPAFENLWLPVIEHPRLAEADLSALRLIQTICTHERLAQLQARLPRTTQTTAYGSTECCTNLTLPFPDDPYEVRMSTQGAPVEGMEVRIVDPETREPLPTGVTGELCFRGYSRFEGYYKDPELTAATIDADGWFHSGDRAALDEHGRLIYGGRIKDMLKVGGENVSALEVEAHLTGHEAVGIVAVVAAPDARYGEVPAAFVECRPGATVTEEEIIDFCVGQIATYKVPRYVRVVTEWPMSGTKIQKFALRERIAAELAAAGISEAPRISSRRPEPA